MFAMPPAGALAIQRFTVEKSRERSVIQQNRARYRELGGLHRALCGPKLAPVGLDEVVSSRDKVMIEQFPRIVLRLTGQSHQAGGQGKQPTLGFNQQRARGVDGLPHSNGAGERQYPGIPPMRCGSVMNGISCG